MYTVYCIPSGLSIFRTFLGYTYKYIDSIGTGDEMKNLVRALTSPLVVVCSSMSYNVQVPDCAVEFRCPVVYYGRVLVRRRKGSEQWCNSGFTGHRAPGADWKRRNGAERSGKLTVGSRLNIAKCIICPTFPSKTTLKMRDTLHLRTPSVCQ